MASDEEIEEEIWTAILKAASDLGIGVRRIHISRGKKVRIVMDDGGEIFRTVDQILSSSTEHLFGDYHNELL